MSFSGTFMSGFTPQTRPTSTPTMKPLMENNGTQTQFCKAKYMMLPRRLHPVQPENHCGWLSSYSSHLLEKPWSHCVFEPVLVCTYRQHLCQSQGTAEPALLTFPPCWQEGSVQAVHVHELLWTRRVF